MTRNRLVGIAALAALLVAAVAWFALRAGAERPTLPVMTELGGDFELAAAGGKRVRLQDYRGRAVLLFFGYLHCPDVCPTTLATLKQATEKLGDRVQVIMVSVDPQRDSPDDLAQYVRYFDARFVGLSGTESEVDRVARQYRAFRQKEPSSAGGYSVSHSGYVYLLDREGKVRALFGSGASDAEIADGVRQLL
jgi:protein SCO1